MKSLELRPASPFLSLPEMMGRKLWAAWPERRQKPIFEKGED